MSGTSALLNLLEGSGSPLLNAPEAAQNGVSEADSSYFVSLMKQYEGSEGLDEPSVPEPRDPALELLGNGLPIPVATPLMLPAAVEAEADTRLEEFAVGLGIDRELARLLLRETAAEPTASEVDSMRVPLSHATSIPLSVAMPPSESPMAVPWMPQPASVPLAERAPSAIPQSVVTPAPVAVPAEKPITASLITEPSAALTADRAPTPRSEIPLPRAAEISLPLVGTAAPALRDEDVLRWRAFIHRSSSGMREPAQEIAAQAASNEALDPVSGAPRRGLSEADFAAATASLRGFALERQQILTSTVTPVGSTVLTGVLPGDSPVNPAVLPVAVSAPPSVPVTVLADPLTTPLRVPDPALQHELRAEQFAEQVGRRMLQQIREDRWTVNLQLDPQRLGPMEIELQLEGNQVTAQVGVANAEVRHLLESALPKLRESLDSAGLNLANWSFAQSGAREYREFAQQSAAAAAKAAPKGSEVAIEDEVSRRVTEDSASRVVDVYV
jgi:flagellar hook-length control protein FliK